MTTVWTECEFAPSSPGILSLRVWPDGVRRAGACVRFFLMVDLRIAGCDTANFDREVKKSVLYLLIKPPLPSATALYVHF